MPIYGLVLAIVIADGLTPAGIVVGILLGVPILLSSTADDRVAVLGVSVVALAGFLLAAILGEGPISPEAVWLPNRVLAMVAILASTAVALLLQRRRLESEAAYDLSRVLHSLMAHDLRAPLALAQQAIEAVGRSLRSDAAVDSGLVADVEVRLRRSLRAIQLVLDSARAELGSARPGARPAPLVDVERELREEMDSFAGEAAACGKTLMLEVDRESPVAPIEAPVLRQSVAILLDNAIRYAVPGPVRVSASLESGALCVRVCDSGPQHGTAPEVRDGEGLGLRLCGLLAERAGGGLDALRSDLDGTEFRLTLPLRH